MTIYCKRTHQKIPIGRTEAWQFLSSPHNLKSITPPQMGFVIKNEVNADDKMYPGQIIVYKINLFPGIRTEWVTEITHVNEGIYFIDEQRFGPYSLWHHKHQLTSIDGGVLMEDLIHFKIPLGILGRIMHFLFLKRRIDAIFDFRHKALESIFGKFPN